MRTDEDYVGVVDDLNEILTEKAIDEGCSFSYETNGWFHGIKFNERFIWDSENDTRRYITDDDGENTDEQESLLECVKREFNKYVNLLNKCRFPNSSKGNGNAFDIVDGIFDELNGRKGFDLNSFDEETQDEIFQACVFITEKYS